MDSDAGWLRPLVIGLTTVLSGITSMQTMTAAAQNIIGAPIAETVEFLRSQDPDSRGAFFSSCKIAVPAKSRSENYVLVVPLQARQAFLALTVKHNDERFTVNMATLSLGGGKFALDEAMGGEWTYQRLQTVTNDLLTKGFRLTFDYTEPFALEPSESCAITE